MLPVASGGLPDLPDTSDSPWCARSSALGLNGPREGTTE
jgi:hypothetical protein